MTQTGTKPTDIKLRRLIYDVSIRTKSKGWRDDSFAFGRQETLQYLDPVEGWKEIPSETVFIDVKKD